jgi:hypothetical protein
MCSAPASAHGGGYRSRDSTPMTGTPMDRGAPPTMLDLAWIDRRRVLLFGGLIVAYYAVLTGYLTVPSPPPRGDFLAFYSAARMALAGDAAGAYDWARLQPLQAEILGVPADAVAGFLGWVNPPHFFFAVLPFALPPFMAGWLGWVLVTAILFGLAARAVMPAAGIAAAVAALATPGVFYAASIGQNGLLIGALLGWTFAWMDRRPAASGIALGLLTIKPQFGVLLPLILVATGRWRVFAWASATALLAMAAALAAFGPAAWWGFLEALARNQDIYLAERTAVLPRIQSVYALAYGLGAARGLAWVIHGAFALAVVAAVLRLWLRRPHAPEEARAAAAMAGVFLVTPFTWIYDTPALAMAALFLARAGCRDGFLRGERALLILACALVQLMALLGPWPGYAPAAWLLILACAWRRDGAWRASEARSGPGRAAA